LAEERCRTARGGDRGGWWQGTGLRGVGSQRRGTRSGRAAAGGMAHKWALDSGQADGTG